jgi:CRISPR-associated protein Cmr2
MKTIAMTLGPIVSTLSLGRKTSEIWAASYLFSLIMKKSVDKLRKIDGVQFIVPYAEDDALFDAKDGGIGRFHDRFILQSDTIDLETVRKKVDEARDEVADLVAEAIGEDEEKVREEFGGYVQSYLYETEEPLDNPILDTSPWLDALELHTPPLPNGDGSLRRFLRRNVIVRSEFAQKSFGAKPSFQSIPAIAAQEEDKEIERSEGFKNAYRYIAIVHADGDNLGKVIKEYGQKGNKFSKKLFDFGERAAKTLKDFGAQTLFVGGDDLLFFSPVLHRDGRTVFDLVEALDEDYAQTLQKPETTLSFGISVTYYKYPLYEALERSRNALSENAKFHPGKNAVTLTVQKHSGQSFAFTLGKEEASYETFKELLRVVLNEKTEIPHSIHHKLDALSSLWQDGDHQKISNVFDNFFNEEIHKNKFAEGLKSIRKLTEKAAGNKQAKARLFAMLSTIKLLRGDR